MFHLQTPLPDQESILTPETIAVMQRHDNPTDKDTYGYELGWGWKVLEGGDTIVMHDGGSIGARTECVMLPDQRAAIVVLTPGWYRADEIRDVILGRLIEGRSTKTKLPSDHDPDPETEAADLEALGGLWSGTIGAGGPQLSFVIEVRGTDEVRVRLARQLWTILDDAGVEGRRVYGRFQAFRAGSPLAAPWQAENTVMRLDLEIVDGELRGTATAEAVPDLVRNSRYCASLQVSLERSEEESAGSG